MKTIVVTSMLICFCSLFIVAHAESPSPSAKPNMESKMTFQGTIIDNKCATANKDSLASFTKTHTKECALMPGCAASGYSLYTSEGALIAFTKGSSKKVEKFLKNSKSKLEVSVVAEKEGNEMKLISIKNKD
jgi:hypothetical protein